MTMNNLWMNNFVFETIQKKISKAKTDTKANFKFKSSVTEEYSYGSP